MVTFGGLIEDIFQVGKDVFLQREATKDYIERQAASIEQAKILEESKQAQEGYAMTATTRNLLYMGGAVIAIALFIGLYKSI